MMADNFDIERIHAQARTLLKNDSYLTDPIQLMDYVDQLWRRWAHFELIIVGSNITPQYPPMLIKPELIPDSNQLEFVYDIFDYGNKFVTSKATDMYTAGLSMCKLYYTIEKIIFILIERLEASGWDGQSEVQVIFEGHELAKRKAFESIINLTGNVIVNDYDPGTWGEGYIKNVKVIGEKGLGYPEVAPRPYVFRRTYGSNYSFQR